MADNIQRKWMPYAKAAQFYVGIDKDVLLAAIKRHELPAFEKPKSERHQRREDSREYHSYFVNTDDVDAYIRTHWPQAFPTT